MKSLLKKIALACALVSPAAIAFEPASGLWWNPNESGRGFAVDYQNGILIVTGFVYNTDGTPTFVQAAGNFNGTDFTAGLSQVSGGQCLGCAYKAPTAKTIGTFTMHFTSDDTATITFPGGSDTLQHELYGFANQAAYLYGEWSFEYQILGTVFAEWVVFNSTYTGSDGTVYVSGQEDSQSGTAALGILADGAFVVAVSDGSFTDSYIFPNFDDRHMKGLGDIYTTSQSPTTPKYAAIGNRILSTAQLQGHAAAASMYSVPSFTRDDQLRELETVIRSIKRP
jgi:hypothetical protein